MKSENFTPCAEEFRAWLEENFGPLNPSCLNKIRDGGKGRARRLGEKRGQEDIAWTLGVNGHGVATAWDRPEIGTQHFTSKGAKPETPEQRRKRFEQFEAEQETAIKLGRERCAAIIAKSRSAAADHPYLKKKQIGPEYLRQGEDGRLIVEVRSPSGAIPSVQFIDTAGNKRFLEGAPLPRGHYAYIPGSRADKVVLVEGWATGKTISEAMGGTVAVLCAMSAANLHLAARVASDDYPLKDVHFLIAADADGAGRKAGGAALAILRKPGRHAVMVFPRFPEGHEDKTDFNDLAILKGHDEVRQQILAASKEAAPSQGKFQPALVGIDGVLASQQPQFVVPELLPVGLTLLAAPPKSGKSMLALQLAAAIAAGGKFLGFDIAQPGTAIYLALDNDAEWRIKQRLLQMFGDDPTKLAAAVGDRFFVFCGPWEAGNYEALREVCERKPGTKFVVIDVLLNLQRGKRKEENVYAYDYGAIGPITAIANEVGIAIVGVTHTNKRQDVSTDLERVTGSMGVTAAGSSVWMLERSKEDPAKRVLKMTGRDVPERELLLRFDQVAATFSFAGEVGDKLTEAEERLARIITIKGPIRFKDLRAAAGLSEARVTELLNRLVAHGVVNKEGGTWKTVSASSGI